MKRILGCNCVLFLIGGTCYGLIELLWRRYTHWSMVLTGGFCFTVLYRIFKAARRIAVWKKCCIGSLVITLTELIVGWAVNIRMRLGVWDYSNHLLNLRGQICPLYSLLWGLLTLPISMVCSSLCKRFDL